MLLVGLVREEWYWFTSGFFCQPVLVPLAASQVLAMLLIDGSPPHFFCTVALFLY